MFIIDDILLSPVKGFMWIVRELHDAAERQMETEAEELTNRLSTLYMELETGQITPEEFDAREREVLDRLAQLEGDQDGEHADSLEPDDDDEEDDDDDSQDDEQTDDQPEDAADIDPQEPSS